MAKTPGTLAVDEPPTIDKRADTNVHTRAATVVQREIVSIGSGDDTTSERIADVTAADALKVDGSAVTQPISAASLPLPAGASTAALQLPDSHNVTVDNAAAGAAVNVQDGGNSLTIDGTVTASQATASFLNVEVQGDAAHDAAASGNPVLCGAQMETMADSAPGTRAGTDGDANNLATLDGALYVIPTGPQSYQTVNLGLLTAAVVKAAPAAGLSLYVTAVTFSIGAATASTIKLISSATDIWGPHYLEAVIGRGIHATFPTPVKVAAATALTATSTGSTIATLNVYGFTAPG